jgi:formylglycine-generating enzyme required for sulfatase activity
MSRYETTNDQYCQFLNEAKAAGLITVYNDNVYAVSDTSHSQIYLGLYPGFFSYSQIIYSGGVFSVHSRDGYYMGNHPVVEVSWYGATAFCNYYGWRLPTEWQWQAVADHYGEFTYGCGTTVSFAKANYWDSHYVNPLNLSSWPYTNPVNHYPSYGYEMNGMAGNVSEWTDSWYSSSQLNRVIRGAGWGGLAHGCMVSYRGGCDPRYTYSIIGFRVCR